MLHGVSNMAAMGRRPAAETREFIMHPQYNSIIGNIYSAVTNEIVNLPFNPNVKDRSIIKSGDRTTRIEQYLSEVQGYSRHKVDQFASDLIRIVNRRNGKKNTMWIQGISDSGKSQFMESFCRTYFMDQYGTPNNNPKTTFIWNDCLFKRLILWEEPHITIDNIEDTKIILGGQDCRVDAKYQTGAVLIGTPFIITSNHELWYNCPEQRQALMNRVVRYKFTTVASDPLSWFPITSKDWRNFLISKRHLIEDHLNVVGYQNIDSDDEDFQV